MKNKAQKKELTCIGCPLGCSLAVVIEDGTVISITGQECNKGERYACEELTKPQRTLTTTVAIEGALWKRLPVKVNIPVNKNEMSDLLRVLTNVKVQAPVKCGDIVVANISGIPECNLIATRTMNAQSSKVKTAQ
jgi:CxxC motif-containing protein